DFEFLRVVKNDQDGESYAISYVDDEGDIVSITSDTDLLDCVRINQQLNNNKADLYIHNPHESAPVNEMIKNKQPKQEKQEILKGIPNEILIPGALAVLATSIIVGFTMGKK
ncbi:MAG: hypothetical protein L0I92_08730, partial [Staphylococcus equorum]|nr:hypothetical protein [Staphylococcus equorum]